MYSPPRGPLFKYRALPDDEALRRLEQILLHSKVFMSRMGDLNDPFEGKVHAEFNSTPDRVRQYWLARKGDLPVQTVDDFEKTLAWLVKSAQDPQLTSELRSRLHQTLADTGVFCMTDTARSIPMWSYYANGHTGVCVRFKQGASFNDWALSHGALMPVQYSDAYPTIKFYETSDDEKAMNMVGTKAAAWSHENEWRIANTGKSGLIEFPPELLDGVVLGARMKPEMREAVLALVARRSVATDVLEARLEEREFAVVVARANLA